MTWLAVVITIVVALAVKCWHDERRYMRWVAKHRAACQYDEGEAWERVVQSYRREHER